MTIELRVSGVNADQIRKQIEELLGGKTASIAVDPNDFSQVATIQQPVAAVVETELEVTPIEAPAPAKRGRPRKKAEPAPEPEEQAIPDEIEASDEVEEEIEIAPEDAEDEHVSVEIDTGLLSHDDVRAALKSYRQKYGMGPTQIDGAKVLTMLFKNVSMISEIPEDQESLAKAVAGIEEMLLKNPFKRQAVS